MSRRRRALWVSVFALVVLALVNGMAWRHARAMTTYVRQPDDKTAGWHGVMRAR